MYYTQCLERQLQILVMKVAVNMRNHNMTRTTRITLGYLVQQTSGGFFQPSLGMET